MGNDEMSIHEHMQHDMGQQTMEHHPSHVEQGDMKRGEHSPLAKHAEHTNHHAMMVEDFKKRFFVSIIITIPVLLLSPIIREFLFTLGITVPGFSGDIYVLFLLSTVLFFYGGWPFLKGIRDELTSHAPGMMTLIAIAITVAYVYSSLVVFGLMGMIFFWELATLIDIMLLGHWLEMRSIMGTSKALEELARLLPSDAHRVDTNGNVNDVPLEEIIAGDLLLVKPGEKIPADGVVVEGNTSVNEAMLTGESKPVTKIKDKEVIGGSINGEGAIKIKVKKTGAGSFLSQVVALVREAQESKSHTQDLADRAAKWLTIISLSVGTLTLLVWTLLIQANFAFSLERAVTVMVITCPHALGLAIPLVVAISSALAARNGLLIRNRVAFENARNLNAIIFDKTGTLTQGKFGITETVIFDATMDEKELLKYATSVEANSEHHIARGIAASMEDMYNVEDFLSIPGKGAQGMVEGKEVKVVSPGYLREQGINVENEVVDKLRSQGKTVVYVMMDGIVKGAIALADIIRPESKLAISTLKEIGIKCMMLTGDNEQVARWVAEEIGLDEYFAEVLPQEKAAKVKEVQSRGLVVAMTGDGVNDAPALAQADIGIAIGAGTDVAVETADIILVKSNPKDVVSIVVLSRATYRKMLQNLFWATGYNVVAIPLAAGVLYNQGILLSPAVGAVLMSLSTIIVAINARFLSMTGLQNPELDLHP
ncbi:copper/silver-translocating P-type ATPase,heavy metal-translocating P-type ATPase, Cd/Co/Hg/Pb/Zn-transporting [Methanomethylovorans hollandica DSM 15978]|uniref:Copper/silver-translocating P-type ATPase,heavy metal-translocating P-type ATPase, Cd/Co/Hg/Pb/Zn-transporting n=1 Tax=Methanomethylovorans hollandica (strain DSM 15978 / NBRC 107637 / DMS1) TaxID=867904 RepID=L0KWG2_METHD|nr:copper/silver-translocating P-type ATPase,heavy metal-translocating P-type ATPase, Cd/Co/Hg/Pb/Zn-transporting [Methanomethylovorans hollandica DSM 15978]